MEATKQNKKSRLSFPVGSHENPIVVDGGDDILGAKTFKSASTRGKPPKKVRGHDATKAPRVVIDLTTDTNSAVPDVHRQLLKIDPRSRKRSHLQMTDGVGLGGPYSSGFPLPRAHKWREPYAQQPLPRFPRPRMIWARAPDGRLWKRREFGNCPHTVPDRSLLASWAAHARKSAKQRMKTRSINNGREKLRLEMAEEEDLSLSQGDVSKKGPAIPCKLAI